MSKTRAIDQLTDSRMRRFAELKAIKRVEYLRKTDAEIAEEAGYSPRSSHTSASRLLKNPKITAAINELCNELWEAEAMPIEESIALLSRTARFNPTLLLDDYNTLDLGKLKKMRAIVAEISVEETSDSSGWSALKSKVKGDAIAAQRLLEKMRERIQGGSGHGEQLSTQGQAEAVLELTKQLRDSTEKETP